MILLTATLGETSAIVIDPIRESSSSAYDPVKKKNIGLEVSVGSSVEISGDIFFEEGTCQENVG